MQAYCGFHFAYCIFILIICFYVFITVMSLGHLVSQKWTEDFFLSFRNFALAETAILLAYNLQEQGVNIEIV